ncbi:hypothetical protein, partial [Variovorax boronicumulans]|uniref:hypothetical protein n=1 Tax=Variovorax boronicumulans TaxID=436515 RepID=UPI001CBC76E5
AARAPVQPDQEQQGSQQKKQTACAASTTSLGGKQVAQFASRLAITLITIVKLHAPHSPCVGFVIRREEG